MYISNILLVSGPIDNSDFLCRHGGVLPLKAKYVYDLCIGFPGPAWDHLHSSFGGGPACTRLYECSQCRSELDALTKQKRFELEEFKTLHAEFQEQESYTSIACLSSSWFKLWEAFVTGRKADAPGPIDNKSIVTSRSGVQVLRPGSDYLQISPEIWLLFHSIYGGGPEVTLRPNGVSTVTQMGNKPTLPCLNTRLRARSMSESQQQQQQHGRTTRSKSSKSETESTVASPAAAPARPDAAADEEAE